MRFFGKADVQLEVSEKRKTSTKKKEQQKNIFVMKKAMATEVSGKLTISQFCDDTSKVYFLQRPQVSLVLMAAVVLITMHFTQTSAEDVDALHDEMTNRFLEQIPLSLLIGYLLFRTFNPQTFSENGKNITRVLVYLVAFAAGAYVLMNNVSYFANDDEDRAVKRKEKVTQIGAQSLVCAAIFMVIGSRNSKNSLLAREGENSWNPGGRLRHWFNIPCLLIILILLGVVNVGALVQVFQKKQDTSVNADGWQIFSRVLIFVVTFFVVVNACVCERQFYSNKLRAGFGLTNLASTDSFAFGGQSNVQAGYEI